MSKPHSRSVTDIPCTCGYLAESARDPNLGVIFKPEINEYHLEHVLPSGGKIVTIIYHCPFCGGVASETRRNQLFANVSDNELARLRLLIQNLKTVDEVVRVLGDANEDQAHAPLPPEIEHYVIRADTGEPKAHPTRALQYTGLSETATVHFTVFANGKVESSVLPKYIGPPGKTWD